MGEFGWEIFETGFEMVPEDLNKRLSKMQELEDKI